MYWPPSRAARYGFGEPVHCAAVLEVSNNASAMGDRKAMGTSYSGLLRFADGRAGITRTSRDDREGGSARLVPGVRFWGRQRIYRHAGWSDGGGNNSSRGDRTRGLPAA